MKVTAIAYNNQKHGDYKPKKNIKKTNKKEGDMN